MGCQCGFLTVCGFRGFRQRRIWVDFVDFSPCEFRFLSRPTKLRNKIAGMTDVTPAILSHDFVAQLYCATKSQVWHSVSHNFSTVMQLFFQLEQCSGHMKFSGTHWKLEIPVQCIGCINMHMYSYAESSSNLRFLRHLFAML